MIAGSPCMSATSCPVHALSSDPSPHVSVPALELFAYSPHVPSLMVASRWYWRLLKAQLGVPVDPSVTPKARSRPQAPRARL